MATHYVSPTGAESWANSTNANSPCSLATANANADDGDIVVLANGTYTTGIVPANSGSSGSQITYTVASGATVTISAGTGINLSGGQDYVTIQRGDGAALNLSGNSYRAISADDADHLVLDGIAVKNVSGATDSSIVQIMRCDYLTVKNCDWTWDYTGDKYCDAIDFQACKYMDCGPGNRFGDGTHTSVVFRRDCQYVRIHGNLLNNRWRHGLNIVNSITLTGESGNFPRDFIVEGNTFRETGSLTNTNPYDDPDCRGRTASAIHMAAQRVIIRNNIFDQCDQNILFYTGSGVAVSDNHLYHNTFYQPQDRGSRIQEEDEGVTLRCYYSTAVSRNRFANNIICDPWGQYAINFSSNGGSLSDNTFAKNIIYNSTTPFKIRYGGSTYTTIAGLPADFVGTIGDDPLLVAPENDDFDIGATSPGAAGATFLATVASVAGDTLTLGDYEAYAFAPASWNVPNFDGDTIYNQDGDSGTVTARPAHNQITLDTGEGANFAAGDTLTVIEFTGAAPNIGVGDVTVIDDPVTTGDTEYVGWYTSSGEPTTDPTSGVLMTDDRTYLRKWTATEDGIAYSVRFYVDTDGWNTSESYVVVYKMVLTTLQLIGYASIEETLTADAWTDEILITEAVGRTLAFGSGDDLYYGVAAVKESGAIDVGRNDSGGTGLYYSTLEFTDGVHFDLTSSNIDTTADRDMAFVFGYNPPATDTTGPTVTFRTPEDDPHTVTGEHTIDLLGRASDPSGVTLVVWETDHGNSGIAIGGNSWTANSVPLAAGATEITVTATDALGNEDDATLTVNFAAPAGSDVIGWDDGDSPPTDNPPEVAPTSQTFTSDRTYLFVAEEASEAGTVAGVYFYASTAWNPVKAWAVVYKVVGSDAVLIAKAEITQVAYGAWNYMPITVAESEQSLLFSSGDYLTAGIACDVSADNPGGWGRNTTGGTGLWYSSEDISTAPIASFTTASLYNGYDAYDPGFALCYVPRTADETLPTVTVTSHTGTEISAGDLSAITLYGSASDPVGIASVTWADDQGNSGTATGTEFWTIEDAALAIGTTVFTITVTDLAGNVSVATLNVVRASASAARLPSIYDGDKITPAMTYQSATSPGSWEWIQYAFVIRDIIDQVLVWSPNEMVMVVALSDDGETWTYYGGDSENNLVAGTDGVERLVLLDSWEYRHTKYVRMTGGGCYSMPLPNAVAAQYARLHFWAPYAPSYISINELRVERQVVAEQILADNLGAITANLGTVSSGTLHSETLSASAGVLMDLNTGVIYVGGSVSRKIELNGPSGTVFVREGGKLVVGNSNVVIDSTNIGSSQGRIEVAPDGGKAGQDYVLIESGNVKQMYYSAGAHRPYGTLSRIETGVGSHGQTIVIPGYWREQPRVVIMPENIAVYNASYPAQSQKLICRPINIVPVAGTTDRYQFTGYMALEISSASVVGDGTMTGYVYTPTSRNDFPAVTVTCSSVESGCQRVAITYSHSACYGEIWQKYRISRTVTFQVYYSAAWHTIKSESWSRYTTYADRIISTADSGWVGADITSYRLTMSGTNAYEIDGDGDQKSQSLEPISRTEWLSATTQQVTGQFTWMATGR